MADEAHINGPIWQLRYNIDRRFWMTSGGWPDAIGFGVVNDMGDIVRTDARPLEDANG